ncbi:homoserine dehydrogenase [Candidatus Pacearchaeota archaeon]|nr:homoserine dehydrogenase [Candidatus Pacearchaeota archaeon]
MKRIGIIGLGTLGSEVAKQLNKQGLWLVLCDIDESKQISGLPFTTNANIILNDPKIYMVVELIGGYHPAYEFIAGALKNGKNVVTANKAVIDQYGSELEQIAIENEKCLKFEAAVGGAIPVIDAIQHSLTGNNTKKISGILNGTTNYILTRMHESLDYETALKEAQEKGFAEADPSFDIKGKDAAQKIAILASINFKTKINSEKFYVRGINSIGQFDIRYANSQGWVTKLIASAEVKVNGLELKVCPTMISQKHPLASVAYERNAVHLQGDANITLAGEGAGKAAATSVISDVKRILNGAKPERYFGNNEYIILSNGNLISRFYLRFDAVDKPGVLHHISGVLSDNKISIWKVEQLGESNSKVPVAIVTYETYYSTLNSALGSLDRKIADIRSIIHVLA